MLNSGLLYFLPLALIPIIVHLITLWRLPTVELSTFSFLMDMRNQQRRHLLLELLLMLLRGLFVALIVLALARPVMSRLGLLAGAGSERDVTLIIDAGPTMALSTGGSSSLERAKTVARKIAEFLEARDHLTLLRAGNKPEALVCGFVGAYPGVNRTIDSINVSAAAADLAAALEAALEPAAKGKRTIYLITDGNEASWAALKDRRLRKLLNADVRIVVMKVGPREPIHNSAIIGDTPENTEAVAGLPTELKATVLNSSKSKTLDTILSVIIEDEQVERCHIELPPGQKRTVQVSVTPRKAGILKGRFELPGDCFPLDDSYLFALNVSASVSVLVIAPPEAKDPQTDPAIYLQAALQTPAEVLGRQAADENEGKQDRVGTIEATLARLPKFDYAMLGQAETIILADAALEKELAMYLRTVVTDGTGLIIFSGARMSPAGYQEKLLDLIPGVPMKFVATEAQPSDQGDFKLVSAIDLAHPILSVFAEGGQDYFINMRMYRHYPLQVPKPPPGATNAAAATMGSLFVMTDGASVMAESKLGKGKILVGGLGVGLDMSDLALKPEFVPFLLRAVTYVRRPSPVQVLPPSAAAQPAVIRITDLWPNGRVDAVDPQDKKYSITLYRSGDTFSGPMLETDQKGYYAFWVMPRHKAAPQIIKNGFAVNLAPGPSAFIWVDNKEIGKRLAPSQLTILDGPVDDTALVAQLAGKKELWKIIILGLFVVFALEFFLATFRQSLKQTGESRGLTQQAWFRRIFAPWQMASSTQEGPQPKTGG